MIFPLIGLGVFLAGVFVTCGLILGELWRVSVRDGVPAVTSQWEIVDRVIAEGWLPRTGIILDLGSSHGWVLRRLWRAGFQGPFEGYETARWPWLVGMVWNWMCRIPVQISHKDFFSAPIEEAKGIYLFLLPKTLVSLSRVLHERTTPGTMIVSAEFPLPGWTPTYVGEARGITSPHAKIYCYLQTVSLAS